MGDIIDLESGKPFKRDEESEASLAVDDQDPVTTPENMARALLTAQKEANDRIWVKKQTAFIRRRFIFRTVFFVLGLLSGFLGWWWIMISCTAIMVLAGVFVSK